jgi:hypothetical protein
MAFTSQRDGGPGIWLIPPEGGMVPRWIEDRLRFNPSREYGYLGKGFQLDCRQQNKWSRIDYPSDRTQHNEQHK